MCISVMELPHKHGSAADKAIQSIKEQKGSGTFPAPWPCVVLITCSGCGINGRVFVPELGGGIGLGDGDPALL